MNAQPEPTRSHPPIAFISHSSKDKERFVCRLEEGLRNQGVQTIFDERDFQLGDSLPEVMLDKGVGIASVNVLVLSLASLESNFVKAERDAAVMRRIMEQVPILILVLDDLTYEQIPMSLRAYIHQDVDVTNEGSIETAIQRTADATHRRRISQAAGDAPTWTQAPVMISDDPLDGALLGVAARAKLEDKTTLFVERGRFFEEAERIGRSREDAEESLKILETRGLLEGKHSFGEGNTALHYSATRYGIDRWLRVTDSKYEENLHIIGASMVNEGCQSNYEIENTTGFNRGLVNHALDELEARGLVEVPRVARRGIRRVNTTAMLRRWLDQQ